MRKDSRIEGNCEIDCAAPTYASKVTHGAQEYIEGYGTLDVWSTCARILSFLFLHFRFFRCLALRIPPNREWRGIENIGTDIQPIAAASGQPTASHWRWLYLFIRNCLSSSLVVWSYGSQVFRPDYVRYRLLFSSSGGSFFCLFCFCDPKSSCKPTFRLTPNREQLISFLLQPYSVTNVHRPAEVRCHLSLNPQHQIQDPSLQQDKCRFYMYASWKKPLWRP